MVMVCNTPHITFEWNVKKVASEPRLRPVEPRLRHVELSDEFPLPEQLPTANEDKFSLLIQSDATAVKLALLLKSRNNLMDQQNRTLAKIPILDTGKFGQCKYKTIQEQWAAILKTFGGNEATKKTKKNLLKQQYGNFKAEDTETLEQTFNRLQLIISQLEFMDIQIEQDDINQKFLTSLALEWLMHTIVWRNRSDLNTISLDDLYNHLKVLEEDMEEDKHLRNCHKTGHFTRECRAPRSQDRGRRDNYRQGSKDHALVADEEAPTEFALMAKTSAECEVFDNSLCSKNCLSQVEGRLVEFKNQEIKFYEKIRGLEVQLEFKINRIESLINELELLKKEKGELDTKLTGFQTASKDLDSLLESQRSDKNKEGLGYSVVPPLLPSPAIESTSDDAQNRNPSVPKTKASPSTISSKPFIKHMTGNISYLSDYEPFDRGYVSFGQGGCKITSKGTIKTKCIVLGRDFKLIYDTNVLLRTPRQHNMYSIDLNNIFPHKDLTCLVAKASADECMLWHRRLGHLNFKTMNKLVRHNIVRGLPTKCFENDHTCIACLKGKQHKASCKSKLVNSVTKPLHTLHMDLFGPTSVSSISHKWYCLVVTDDFSRFTWTFFFKTKDETSGILRKFITKIENLKDLKVKIIRCDNGGEFRNKEMIDFCSRKGIKREIRNARTPQQNGVAKRRNRTLIEAAKTMVLVNKSHNKTLYELFNCRTPVIGFLKPFGYHVMILNTLDHLEKFEAKGDEGTNSTNILGTNDAASQELKKNVSSLRYIALPNWVHDALLESSLIKPQDDCSTDVLESSGNSNPTATSTNPSADQMETLTVETPIPTVSLLVLTACFTDSQEPSNGVEADVSNMETTITTSPTPTLRIHKDHPKSQIIGPVDTPIQTRHKFKEVLKNKKDGREIVIRNKARLVAQGHTQEEGIDYDEVFAPFARIKAIRLFLAYASFMGFTVYQMDVKSAFLYRTIDEEVSTIDQTLFIRRQIGDFILVQVYVNDIIFGSSNPQKEDGIFFSQDKYVGDILKKFGYSDVRSNTPMDKENPWGKDRTGKDVDLHLYRSMIGSLTYLTASRPDIMFVVCAYARHQVTPKECHIHAVKRIFKYLKGHLKLGLWYPKESPFDLVAYSNSDYGGATQDRKSTTRGCQFLGRRLISWQCK
nr:hypothetical protein [Tanacetum cinerariifolium]